MVECPSQGALLVTNAHIQEVYGRMSFQGALLVTNAHIQEVYGRMSFLGSTVGH